MASTTCGYCGRLAFMPSASAVHQIRDDFGGSGGMRQAVYKCPNCHRLNLASEYSEGISSTGVSTTQGAADTLRWIAPQWLPRYRDVVEFEDVPVHIAQAATEATLCLSVGAYRAVGALARAAIEATAKDKGITTGNLASKIDALQVADHVRRHTAEQAHEIRHFGNDMAHGDFVDTVSKEEAEEVVQLMSEVLDEVYQSPARLEKRKAARLTAKGDGS